MICDGNCFECAYSDCVNDNGPLIEVDQYLDLVCRRKENVDLKRRERYEASKDKVRLYYQEHKEEIRKRYQENRAKRIQYGKQYYRDNREQRLDYQRRYNEKKKA